jgi:hypothetical protein
VFIEFGESEGVDDGNLTGSISEPPAEAGQGVLNAPVRISHSWSLSSVSPPRPRPRFPVELSAGRWCGLIRRGNVSRWGGESGNGNGEWLFCCGCEARDKARLGSRLSIIAEDDEGDCLGNSAVHGA